MEPDYCASFQLRRQTSRDHIDAPEQPHSMTRTTSARAVDTMKARLDCQRSLSSRSLVSCSSSIYAWDAPLSVSSSVSEASITRSSSPLYAKDLSTLSTPQLLLDRDRLYRAGMPRPPLEEDEQLQYIGSASGYAVPLNRSSSFSTPTSAVTNFTFAPPHKSTDPNGYPSEIWNKILCNLPKACAERVYKAAMANIGRQPNASYRDINVISPALLPVPAVKRSETTSLKHSTSLPVSSDSGKALFAFPVASTAVSASTTVTECLSRTATEENVSNNTRRSATQYIPMLGHIYTKWQRLNERNQSGALMSFDDSFVDLSDEKEVYMMKSFEAEDIDLPLQSGTGDVVFTPRNIDVVALLGLDSHMNQVDDESTHNGQQNVNDITKDKKSAPSQSSVSSSSVLPCSASTSSHVGSRVGSRSNLFSLSRNGSVRLPREVVSTHNPSFSANTLIGSFQRNLSEFRLQQSVGSAASSSTKSFRLVSPFISNKIPLNWVQLFKNARMNPKSMVHCPRGKHTFGVTDRFNWTSAEFLELKHIKHRYEDPVPSKGVRLSITDTYQYPHSSTAPFDTEQESNSACRIQASRPNRSWGRPPLQHIQEHAAVAHKNTPHAASKPGDNHLTPFLRTTSYRTSFSGPQTQEQVRFDSRLASAILTPGWSHLHPSPRSPKVQRSAQSKLSDFDYKTARKHSEDWVGALRPNQKPTIKC
eukprot:GILK01010965.1.p1 GENE.GILK01010965.1~~GILK01010965.1.p1  ORF type:complete len:713 (+),score=108.50 GILK01010965.1:28-2139(+)